MQPFPSPPGPERRGHLTLVAFLAAGFLVASTIVVVEFVQLRAANDRIEELEAREGRETDDDSGDDGDGGLFGELEDIFDDVLGETGDLFGGSGQFGSLLDCFGSPFSDTGEAGLTVGEIAAQVEGIRELSFAEDVQPTFLSDREMTERVRELFLEEYTPRIADLEERLLTTLGAIPPGTDLRDLRADAIGQQVGGFYDTETKELVVRRAGAELSVLDRITLAHELTHALTDQALRIPLPDEVQIAREDADLAALALVEGDATFVMQRYTATLGFDEQFDLLDPETIAASEAGLSEFPPYLRQELLFPYEEGLRFVCDLYAEGGWEAVNAAYEDPPASTAQILFPDRYGAGEQEPVDPRDPADLRGPWRLQASLQLGAANLWWLFSAPGGETEASLSNPRERAGDWGGGQLELWADGERTAIGISLVQRKAAKDPQLCNSLDQWYRASVPDDVERAGVASYALVADGERQDAVLACDAGSPRLGIGPDLRTARALVR